MLVLCTAGPGAQAQGGRLPDLAELEAAASALAPQAEQLGLDLRIGGLWWAALKARTPLVAGLQGRTCWLGYTAYTPGQDFRWLFPELEPADRALWLRGLLAHELAHCVLDAAAALAVDPRAQGWADPAAIASGNPVRPPLTAAAGWTSAWLDEVRADLAFAWQLLSQPRGQTLLAHLTALRSRRASADPLHDSSRWLACAWHRPVPEAWTEPRAGWVAGGQALPDASRVQRRLARLQSAWSEEFAACAQP